MNKFQTVLPVSALSYRDCREEVIEWQDERDYKCDYQPEDVGENRFLLGYTAYFCDSDSLDMNEEACKAILPEIYDWLMENAPNVLVEVDHYDKDVDDESGDATVWLNFRNDGTCAVAFKLRFASQS